MWIRDTVAVGTALAGGPPHRSQRAGLTHWAPTLGASDEAFVREWVHDAGLREPPRREAVHPGPGDAGSLAAAPQRLAPVPGHLGAEGVDRVDVAGHGVVGLVPAHHAGQPSPLLRDGLVPAPPSWSLTSFSLARIRFEMVFRRTQKVRPRLRADVREAEERERLRLPGAPRLPVPGGEPPELDQPRLAGVQFQPEPREPLAQLGQELLGVSRCSNPTMKSSAKRTMITSPRACRLPPPVGPQVQDVVQVHVREQRRYRCPLR